MEIKVLFFGLGSIGLRHAKLLLDNFDVEIAAYRTTKNENKLKINEFRDYEAAFDFKPDIAFITNPTSLHIKTALDCAKKSIDLFIEKPLSHTLSGVTKLSNVIKKNHLFSYVAFCLRFHPVIKYLKNNLNLKDVIYSRINCSSYLPLWRPDQNYKDSYSANSSMGGGVINDMIHELDYCEYLFGRINDIKGTLGNTSTLEINSEDFAELTVTNKNNFMSQISLDYFSHQRERIIKIYTKDFMILGDLNKYKIEYY